jgi:hypothetical protein
MRSATIAMLENAGFPSVQAHAIVEAIEIVAQTRRGSGTTVVALRCWIEARRVCLELSDQRQVSFPIMKYPSLAKASVSELEKVHIRRQGWALRWESLDEDIWVDDAVCGRFPRSPSVAAV